MLTSRIVRSRARLSLRDANLVEETRDIGCYRRYPEGLGDSSEDLRENTERENASSLPGRFGNRPMQKRKRYVFSKTVVN